jgi:hypothetical protein
MSHSFCLNGDHINKPERLITKTNSQDVSVCKSRKVGIKLTISTQEDRCPSEKGIKMKYIILVIKYHAKIKDTSTFFSIYRQCRVLMNVR